MNIRRQLILDKHLNGVDYNNGHELNSAVIAAMEEYKDEVMNKNEHLHFVSNRRELLIDFFRKVSKVRLDDKGDMYTVTKMVDEYLKDN